MTVFAFAIGNEELWKKKDSLQCKKLIALLKLNNVVGSHQGFFDQLFLFETREQRDRALSQVRQIGFDTADITIDSGEIDDAYRRN